MSLWDMLRFDAKAFLELMALLDRLRLSIERSSKSVKKLADLSVEKRKHPEVKDVRKEVARNRKILVSLIQSQLEVLSQHCSQLQLPVTESKIERIREELQRARSLRSDHDLPTSLRELVDRVQDELSSRMFLYMAPGQSERYEAKAPFGATVAARFPTFDPDIAEASRCLACERWTAAVFHLMRVMELALKELTAATNANLLALGHNPNWGGILGATKAAILAMPTATPQDQAKRQHCERAQAYLQTVKDVWRNPTMHVESVYGREDAEKIFGAVRTFVDELTKL